MEENTQAQQRPIVKKSEGVEAAPSLAAGVPAKKRRAYTFTIPASVRIGENDPKTVTLCELDDAAISQARKLGRGDENKAAVEAVKAAIVKVDGADVNQGEEEATWYWHRWSAKVRHQLELAWAKVHVTTADEDKDFFSSMVPE